MEYVDQLGNTCQSLFYDPVLVKREGLLRFLFLFLS